MTLLERRRIADAIAQAERGTSGRIAVRLISDDTVDALDRAKTEFERIGMRRHEPRNSALILVAPKARRYAVLGDRALHERVGDAFWNDVVRELQPLFARDDLAGAIVRGVERLGSAFQEHFASPEAP
ncbi:MAG TPA: TPM domain-containing protein [Candidatus Baltobacteraceae bacterium]|nr:TPM domain-containing protein [Candidatus Baltobacteraceae bacterium]